MNTRFVLSILGTAALAAQPDAPSPTPAEQAIGEARRAIEKNPGRPEPHNALAMALARRARETSDPIKYEEAEAVLKRSFELAPDNFEGQKIRAWLLLGRHRFREALELASELNRRMPDDEMVYGLLTDAHTELGNYREAEKAAQWMLDLSRGGIPALIRAAYLRELFGDVQGAVELMESAYRRIPPAETEDRAWMLTQIAQLHLSVGKVEEADCLLAKALRLFPSYHYALAGLAKVRTAQGKHMAAVELLRRRYDAGPHPENLYDLAVALQRAGRKSEARRAFAEFEVKARAETNSWDNANRELVFYYADYARKPAEALRVAQAEFARRRDVHTLDAYAWALHINRRYAEARKHIEAALAIGTRDPRLLYHAGVISSKLPGRPSAERYLRQSLDVNPRSEVAEDVRRLLARLR